ncbi:HAD family phosphatase [Actinoplanes sp. NPDC049802]|uniref:HAD family hydrolase n=1 Tax=Actinoplanes sp. NPDC049802 TaxID=3154742 RepID=UPI0033C56682
MTTDVRPISAPDGIGYDALIFDWDGTLVDSTQVCYVALARALRDVGVLLDPQWYWPKQAIASPDMLIIWEQEFGRLPEPISEVIDRCRRYVIEASPDLVVFDTYAQIARKAHARGQSLAIGSNSADVTVAAGLRETGLDTIFDTAVTWSDVPPGRGKPAPDIFLLAAERLGIDPRRCLVYEDAVHGVEAALRAGMTAFNVQTGKLLQP